MNCNSKIIRLYYLLIVVVALSACSSNQKRVVIGPGPEAYDQLQTALNEATEGQVIELDEGTFEFIRTLTMDSKSRVTLRGQGRQKTTLSFDGQISGAEGMLISNSQHITVSDLTIIDTEGDALKFKDSDQIVMYRVGAEWSGEPDSENGGYGLYPVSSSNILIDSCYAYGASDAGIYVGQSNRAIVRNSTAEGNVAGIEIENTTNADVYDNTVTDNSAGILVFDLPGLSQSGRNIRVFNNRLIRNTRGNFAPKGSIVAEVPAGTGIIVMSTSNVEIFDNELQQNNVIGMMVSSYASMVELGLRPPIEDPEYNVYPTSIYIHDNTYSKENSYPAAEEQSNFGNMLVQSFGSNPIPGIILDGIFSPDSGESGTICIKENKAGFVNLNLAVDFPNNLSFDPSPHVCTMDPIPPVELTALDL